MESMIDAEAWRAMGRRVLVLLAVGLLAPASAAQDTDAHRLHLLAQPPAMTSRAAPAARAAATLADTTIQYDDGNVALILDDGVTRFEAYDVGPDARQANRFTRPADGLLTRIDVAPFYLSDFEDTGVPDSTARNFLLTIWDDDGDGRPGDVLFTLGVEDPRANTAAGAFRFLQLDTLQFFEAELAALPEAFFVGLINTGDDVNHLVMGVSAYEGENVSFLHLPEFFEGQGGWRAFPEISSRTTGDSLGSRVLPIRATFSRPDAPTSVDDAEVPGRLTLFQNYPNPFNPATTIRYALPRTADVRLSVYDLLGRRVATLVDGLQTAGEHTVQLDAATWASGLYFYTLEATGRHQTRRMVVLK